MCSASGQCEGAVCSDSVITGQQQCASSGGKVYSVYSSCSLEPRSCEEGGLVSREEGGGRTSN